MKSFPRWTLVPGKKLLQELQLFLQGKTAIIITHHFEMLQICDQVHELQPPDAILGSKRPSKISGIAQLRASFKNPNMDATDVTVDSMNGLYDDPEQGNDFSDRSFEV